MNAWVAVAGVAFGSLAMRIVPLVVIGRAQLGTRLEALIARAGLAAIVALMAVSTRHAAHGTATWPTLAAVGAGVLLAARRHSMLHIVLIGGAIYTVLRLVTAL